MEEIEIENIPEIIPEENNDSYVNDDLYNIRKSVV